MLLVADRAGQLGNKLWLLSHLICAAEIEGFRLVAPGFSDHRSLFPSLDGTGPTIYGPRRSAPLARLGEHIFLPSARLLAALAVRLGARGNRLLWVVRLAEGDRLDLSDPEIRERLRSTRLVILQGWLFRDEAAIRQCASIVREVFRPNDRIREAARSTVEEVRAGASTVVGVHIRRGDYRKHLGGRFFFPTSVYARVMEDLRTSIPDVSFVVASDEEIDPADLSGLPYVLAPGDAASDLFTLAACDRIVGPPSSFTLWASLYGRTPLAMIVDPEKSPTTEDFRVAPDIKDPQIGKLY